MKMGLGAEDIRQEGGSEAGLAGLFKAMGDSRCDAEAIARSEDGRMQQERITLFSSLCQGYSDRQTDSLIGIRNSRFQTFYRIAGGGIDKYLFLSYC